MKYFKFRLLTSAVLCGLVQTGQAALNAVDPGPYTAATGFFPQWYQDTEAVALDLCLSKTLSSQVPPAVPPADMCTLLPNPGVFDDALPIVFPTNYPDEGFWFTGDAAIDATTVPDPQGITLTYVSALEAAFGGGVPAPGDQISFARIRIRVDVPVAGTYTITHPYGVYTQFVATPGIKAINTTADIGIGAPGDFTGALTGPIGPFLQSVNGPYHETNPDTGVLETFIGDPNVSTDPEFVDALGNPIAPLLVQGERVTGSPFGTNYVRVQGPGGIDVRTDFFIVSGKLFQATLPTPLTVERASYSNTLLGNFGFFETDVFALAPSTATLTFADIALKTTLMDDLDGNSAFYGYDNRTLGVPLSAIDVTAMNPPGNLDTTIPGSLLDLVTINTATYSLSTNELTVEAASSDEINTPVLTLEGTGLTGAGAAGVSFPPVLLTIPPATVTVSSANGGSDTETVVLIP